MAIDLPFNPIESQTQEETQLPLANLPANSCDNADGILKRKTSKTSEGEMTRTSKKIKISVGPAVDLGD